MNISVSLTPELVSLIKAKVATGRYSSTSEVVREALRLLQEQDRLQAVKLDELRKEIRRGLDSGPPHAHEGAALKTELRARRAKRAG